MTTLQHQVSIDADIDQVWAAVADLLAVRDYNPMVASVHSLSEQTEGVGAARRCELKPKGWVEERVWDWAPPHAIGLEVAASDWPLVFMKWRTELHQNGNSTVVTQELNYKLKFGPVGELLDSLVMRRKLDQSIGTVFGNLKNFVETPRS